MSRTPNIFGRKWGRGLRPWLIIPKYLFVSMILGGLVASAVCVTLGASAAAATIVRYQVVPGIIAADITGVLLLLQHPKAFLKMRWMIAKLAMIVLIVPATYLILPGRLAAADARPIGLTVSLLLSLAGFLVISILGRLKPRLNQPYR